MIPVSGYENQTVGVLGLGRTGLATARALRAGGAVPVCWDDNAAAREAALQEGFRVEDLSAPPRDLDFALYVVSPGVPHLYPAPHPAAAHALAHAIPLDNDIGLFLSEVATQASARAVDHIEAQIGAGALDGEAIELEDEACRARVVGVTGTNGKSTTAALIHHVLASSGQTARLAGNIGTAALAGDPLRDAETVVLELSSYQLEVARFLDLVDVGVFTNFSADHVDRHGGLGGYRAAKARLFERARVGVIGVDEAEGRFIAGRVLASWSETFDAVWGDDVDASPLLEWGHGPVIAVSTAGAGGSFASHVEADGDAALRLTPGDERLSLAAAPSLKGAHNLQNAACAAGTCRALGLSVDEIQAGLDSFPGLPHRMQTIAEAGGVAYVNDSKATNADAAEKALRTFDRIRWILGGRAKEGGIETLRPLFDRVAKAYLIGEASGVFAKTLDADGAAYEICGDLGSAVAKAHAEAAPGDTVLLAPAAASFDQFPSFEHRGDAFEAAVKRALGTIDQT